jgi:hypothetical protein
MILLEAAIRNQFAVGRSEWLLNKIQRHILISTGADPRTIPDAIVGDPSDAKAIQIASTKARLT